MTFRRILAAALLLFVAASVVVLVAKGRRAASVGREAPPGTGLESPAGDRQIVAYYFLGKIRCSSCRKIEDASRRAIEGSFRRELGDGRLKFVVVNVDQPENRHFVEEFELDASALVLVEMRGGRATRWRKLSDVWTLVEEPGKLETYVRGEVAGALARI